MTSIDEIPAYSMQWAACCPFDLPGSSEQHSASCAMLTAKLVEARELCEKASELAGWVRDMQQSMMDIYRALPPRGNAGHTLATLTPREREVLHSVACGLSNRQVARELGIAEKTVKNHLYAIFAKLGVSGRTQAALLLVAGPS
jgi:DNA-binding NarL/FixJ family response regulator